MRDKNNPINLCGWCETCPDRFDSLTNCMDICGAPLEILEIHERDRNKEQQGENE